MRIDPAEIRAHLNAKRIGTRIDCLDETDSTSSDVASAARAGAPEGTVVIADSQRRGRGRRGRAWVSPAGRNLYVSILLRPELTAEEAPGLALVTGVAAAECVEEAAGAPAQIKWPNDVLLGGKKVAGILTELEIPGGGSPFVVVGIGVNLNSGAEDFPPDVRALATSILLASGRRVDRPQFAARLLSALDARYECFLRDGLSAILPAWAERDALRGRRVQVRVASDVVAGIAEGLTADGKLRLQTENGAREILAGDVSVIGGYDMGVVSE
jgi:BirA family biotin operon repressor/biotin-[acetyl-CoA-carboxylase] ligase